MVAVWMDILSVIVWCFLVYVCAFDWEAEKENGNKFPGNPEPDGHKPAE